MAAPGNMAQGEAKTPTVPSIGGLTLWAQSIFLPIQPGPAQLSDATSVTAQ